MALFDFDAARSQERIIESRGRTYAQVIMTPAAQQALVDQFVLFPNDPVVLGYPVGIADNHGRPIERGFYTMQALVDACVGHAALCAEVEGIAVLDNDRRVRASTLPDGLYRNGISSGQGTAEDSGLVFVEQVNFPISPRYGEQLQQLAQANECLMGDVLAYGHTIRNFLLPYRTLQRLGDLSFRFTDTNAAQYNVAFPF